MCEIKSRVAYPAIYKTTHTTAPILLSFGFTFTIFAIGLIISSNLVFGTIKIWFEFDIKEIVPPMLIISSFTFFTGAVACIRSQAWNYYEINKELRAALDISEDDDYINECIDKMKFWHKITALTFVVGTIIMLLSLFFIFFNISRFSSIVIGILILCLIVISSVNSDIKL